MSSFVVEPGSDYDATSDIDQQLTLTSINQTWFKFLAVVCFLCAVFVNAALVWLLVCRAQRLAPTDEQIKQSAAYREHTKQLAEKSCKHKKFTWRRKLRYLVMGNLKVHSPNDSNSGSSSDVSSMYTVNETKK